MKIAVECGQSLFSLRSWRLGKFVRTFKGHRGFAVGPVMFIGRSK